MRRINKILIIRFSSLGDIILASPLIRGLRMTYPQAQIDFLVKSEYVELVKFNRNLTKVIELESDEKEALVAVVKRIKSENYDVLLDIHNSLRSRYVRFFSGARYISVVNKRILARWALVRFRWNFYRDIVSVSDRYIETAKRFGVHGDEKGLEVCIPDETVSTIRTIMGRYNLDKYHQVIGFSPASQHFTKRWPLERYVELGIRLAKTNAVKIFIFGGREESDYCGDIAQMINLAVGGSVAENFAKKFSLLETACVIDYCHLVLSNDTGLMHLAVARKRKVVAIFGSTVREFGFFPHPPESIVVERSGLSCRPCTHIGLESCPRGHFKCMKDITVDDVLDAVQKVGVYNNHQHRIEVERSF